MTSLQRWAGALGGCLSGQRARVSQLGYDAVLSFST